MWGVGKACRVCSSLRLSAKKPERTPPASRSGFELPLGIGLFELDFFETVEALASSPSRRSSLKTSVGPPTGAFRVWGSGFRV